ncbi:MULTISPECIES: carbon-nitrogen hydrolase family protein [unclassified Geodermatophilus]|uniref:carbon-nitrogen hydrolase family protein n=1 Tax=unclassified Geodermatophilus TaxID=2637632 RepID=UPI003EEE1EBE
MGVTQWHATTDVAANLAVALDLVGRAAADGARLVVLPENGLMLGTNAQMRARLLREDGPEIRALGEAAAAHGVTVVLGGMKNATADGVFNSAIAIGPDGLVAGRYDKIHLFDARVGGQSFEASSVEQAGSEPVLLDVDGTTVGLTICYDVRFPELSRALATAGAEVLLVPAAFTHPTGRAHWHTLLRARAIENGCYVVAPATVRSPEGPGHDAFETYGHALVVSPWGEVLLDLEERTPAVAVVELDLTTVREVRTALPVLAGTKPAAYRTAPRTIAVPILEEQR